MIASEKLDIAADKYSMETVNAVSQNWDPSELTKRMSFQAPAGLAERVMKAGKPLGALKSATPFVIVGNGWFNDNGVKTSRVRNASDISFEHGSAHVELTVTNRGAGWQVMDFQISPTLNGPDIKKI